MSSKNNRRARRIRFLTLGALAVVLTSGLWAFAQSAERPAPQREVRPEPRSRAGKLPSEWVWRRKAVNLDRMYAR